MRTLPTPSGIERATLVDVPLPGFYPCLTWQLNVTWHQQQGLVKHVSVVREPNDHLEVRRAFSNLTPYSEGILGALSECKLAAIAMREMMGVRDPYIS